MFENKTAFEIVMENKEEVATIVWDQLWHCRNLKKCFSEKVDQVTEKIQTLHYLASWTFQMGMTVTIVSVAMTPVRVAVWIMRMPVA